MRLRVLGLLLLAVSGVAHARVVSTPANAFLDATWQIKAHECYDSAVQMRQGQALSGLYAVGKSATGLGGDQLLVELLDTNNYRLRAARQPYRVFPTESGIISGSHSVSFRAPALGTYFLSFCNSQALLFGRIVTARIYLEGGEPTARDRGWEAWGEQSDRLLHSLFQYPNVDLNIRPCSVVNAYSVNNTGDITFCRELLDSFDQRIAVAQADFVLAHELGHTVLNAWGLPLFDNEDVADEFATFVMILTGRTNQALAHANQIASESTVGEAVIKLSIDDRHSLSIQRARNIARWTSNPGPLLNRWCSLLAAHFTDSGLQAIANSPFAASNPAIVAELAQRARARPVGAPASEPHAAPASSDGTAEVEDSESTVAKLDRLRARHAAGEISDRDFEREKRALLDGH